MQERDKQMLADHYLDFYQIAYTILHEETDVEDAVQDALTDTMSQPFVRDPYGYCCRVLKNKCYKMLKRNTYILTETLPDLPDTPSTIDEERLHTLWKYKERLPARIKEVFDLYYEKGYTRNEIAEITNTPLPTLKKLFNKGHKRLKKQMIEHDNNNKHQNNIDKL